MSLREAREMFSPGDIVEVTNHYITRTDHPCYGTRLATVVRSTTSGLTLEPGGYSPWPKSADVIVGEGRLELRGHPNDDDPFLEIVATNVRWRG